MTGCGCKICQAGLGEAVNDLIREGGSIKSAQEFLKNNGLEVSLKLIKRHLSAFGLSEKQTNVEVFAPEIKPNTVNLNDLDFSEYNFDTEKAETIIDFIQKVNLKILLNQQQIVLQKQLNIIEGTDFEKDGVEFRNLAIAFKLFEASSGLKNYVNLSEAAKALEAQGYTIQSKFAANN